MPVGAAAFLCAVLFAAPDAGYPEDPFAQEYLPPVAREFGTAAGQLRGAAQVGLVGLSPEGFLAATIEAMPSAYLGVRVTASTAFTRHTSTPHLMALGLGASLHLLPYHRVDLSLAFEGGLAALNLFESSRTVMPLLTGRLQLDLWVTSYLFLQLAGQLSGGIYAAGKDAQLYLQPGLFLCVGYAL